MQPRYKQTPPGFASGSISVTLMPRSAARNAAAYPPGPPPTTAILRCEVSDIQNVSFSTGFALYGFEGNSLTILKFLGTHLRPSILAPKVGTAARTLQRS